LLATASLTAFLVALSAFVHYEALRHCHRCLPRLHGVEGQAKVVLAIGAAFCSHLAQIACFALAYWVLHDTPLGSLHGQIGASPMSFLYFSAETYTSLGFGDLYPGGAMRLIAGMEALTGLLMISWSASFTYMEMNRYWHVEER
jgi:hypothetical protein